MAPKPSTPESSIESMLRAWKNSTKSPRTIHHYSEHCYTILRELQAGNKKTYPWEIDKATVTWLLDKYEHRKLAIATRKNYLHSLRTWTEYYNNNVISEMKIRWPTDTRPKVDWLTHSQAAALLRLPKTPTADMIVHCELCLGMRRVEVMRLNTNSFEGDRVAILGKGSMGGKPRLMPYHRDTMKVLDRYIQWRDDAIAQAVAIAPGVVPDVLLIYRQRGKLKTYGETGIDRVLDRLEEELGFAFSNHTLRRTFGRTMYRSGVAPATISRMLGHESIDMTLRYIGVDMDDMSRAMEVYGL